MSDVVLQELVVRMATDAGFADLVRSAPGQTLAAFDLTPDEVAQLSSLGADAGASAEGLAARQSKSSLLFMGVHHPADHGALGHAGLHEPGTPHINLHDPGNTHHVAQAHGSVGPQSHMDGDGTIMITDTGEGGPKSDVVHGTGGHSTSSDGDVPIMLGHDAPKHDLFTGGIRPGGGENVELHGSGPIE